MDRVWGVELAVDEARVLFETVMPHLGEWHRRVLVGALAEALGHGGQAFVVETSGMSSSTVSKAVREVRAGVEVSDSQRVEGGGVMSHRFVSPPSAEPEFDKVAVWTTIRQIGVGYGVARLIPLPEVDNNGALTSVGERWSYNATRVRPWRVVGDTTGWS